jgi:radical SAM superfamily enzyme YgiQ (UPF0313 family)
MENSKNYCGFELGPIRPPSEAKSLQLRVVRNCPWNKCKFCGLYRGKKFSIRPLAHILEDITTIRHYVDDLQETVERPGGRDRKSLLAYHSGLPENQQLAFQTALNWFQGGIKSVFLQDADALIIKPDDLVAILLQVRKTFPQVHRITSYARSQTIARISDENMTRLAQAGLNRIHIGMESASDEILSFIKKGVDKKTHIVAGQKVKRAGIELSEYFMPGLGGEQYSRVNALETADALNQINPDFIRLRTLAIPENVELFKDYQSGVFAKSGDVQTAKELLLFLENLQGITSTVKSDHILNLFQEVEGRLPEDKERMTAPIREFLAMAPEDQLAYIVGRRTGVFFRLADMTNPELLKLADEMREAYQVTLDNVEVFAAGMMQRFI